MNWSKELYDTYENCAKTYAGKMINGVGLLPISLTWVNAHIECFLNDQAELVNAHVINKEDAATMIPCTIDSAKRTSDPTPHPLFDKLTYLAKELNEKKQGEILYNKYRKQLSEWASMEDTPHCISIILEYLDKGTIIQDLVDHKILTMVDGKLIEKWSGDKKEKPPLFNVVDGLQKKAVIRFRVLDPISKEYKPIWLDKTVQDSFLRYYLPTLETRKEKGKDKDDFFNLCMITGETTSITEYHSAYLRYPGDSAKLISSQDNLGFKYSGRNGKPTQAVSVGYIASQKAHNALKWLIQKQGFRHDGLVILSWGTQNIDTPDLTSDNHDILKLVADELPTTFEAYAKQLNIALSGIKKSRFSEPDEHIVVMSMDAATTGRLAIQFYQSMKGSQLIEKLEHWYRTMSFKGMYYFIDDPNKANKKKKRYYLGTPSFEMIVNALYGNINSKDSNMIKREAYTRLLSCMIDQKPLPRNYISLLMKRFCQPFGFENDMQRHDFTAVACAVIRKYRNDLEPEKEEVWKVEVDETQEQAFYLWGRLLAYAHWYEYWANTLAGEERETNATKYRKQFSITPLRGWNVVSQKLIPYRRRFIKAHLIDEVNTMEHEMHHLESILIKDKDNMKSLDDRFVLGYGAQLYELRERYGNKLRRKGDK